MSESAEPSAWIPVQGELRRVTSECEILDIAMGLAADRGDPTPSLIQHTRCTRAEANRVACQAVVPGDRESYLIAVQGRFTVEPRRRRWDGDDASERLPEIYSVMTLIVDAATGAPTDSGFSNDYPDLAAVGGVVTDYRAS
jgi:hypothetical protein